MGSPPLTRERLELNKGWAGTKRITPAYAGTTVRLCIRQSSIRDHPRLRGNDLLVLIFRLVLVGSPPLTRERLEAGTSFPARYRITPAYAGTTSSMCPYYGTARDHPRLRGNDIPLRYLSIRLRGSPPLTRERPYNSNGPEQIPGITPAYAGTTQLEDFSHQVPWDHPR